MGFSARKSIKVAPGVRLNFSKSGMGYSVGAKGVRYTKRAGSGKKRSAPRGVQAANSRVQVAPPSRPQVAKPGITASRSEKSLYKALQTGDTQAMEQVLQTDPKFAVAAASLATVIYLTRGDHGRAHQLTEWVFNNGQDPALDPFILKYSQVRFTLDVVPGATAELGLNRSALGLLLAEYRQAQGDVDGAIHTVEQLEPTTFAALSLAELYCSAGRYSEVVELTDGLSNTDDSTALLLIFRGTAFREQGRFDAARESFKEALKSKKRSPEVRHRALFERGLTYEAEGKKAMARKDFERILAEDSRFEGLQERLAQIDPNPT